MIFYFTTSDMIGSRLIRWGTESEWSHFAFGTRLDDYAVVVESRLFRGVEPSWQKMFIERNQRIEIFYREESEELSGAWYNQIVREIGGAPYDWKAITYWSGVALGRRLGFGKAKNNQWEDRQAFYCTEVLRIMRPYFKGLGMDTQILGQDFLSPAKAYHWLKDSGLFKQSSLK